MKNYVINNETIAIHVKEKECVIFEVDKTLKINCSINKILNYSCINNGSSYKGRVNYINNILSSKYKNPILISEKDNLIMFPICGYRNKSNYLINYKYLKNYKEYDKHLQLQLNNNIFFKVNIKLNTLYNQILKCVIINNNIS